MLKKSGSSSGYHVWGKSLLPIFTNSLNLGLGYNFHSCIFPRSHTDVNLIKMHFHFIELKYKTAVWKWLFDVHLKLKNFLKLGHFGLRIVHNWKIELGHIKSGRGLQIWHACQRLFVWRVERYQKILFCQRI